MLQMNAQNLTFQQVIQKQLVLLKTITTLKLHKHLPKRSGLLQTLLVDFVRLDIK